MKVKLQVIHGNLKRRYIQITKNDNLRPVLTRVRQIIFDILFNHIDLTDAKILDVCCGSGILGIECVSRGAESVVFIDINNYAIKELKDNCRNLDIIHKCKFFNKNALVPPEGQPVDVVFIDLPYESSFLIKKMLRKLAESKWVNSETIVVIPMDKNYKHHLEEHYTIMKQKIIASTKILFLIKKPDANIVSEE